jgi:hypothetical protein
VGGRATLAATLTLAGGVAAGVGSFLTWAEISAGPISERASGVSGWEGKATLVAGVVLIAAAVRAFAGATDALARLRPSAIIGGLVACGVGLYTAITAQEQLLDAAAAELSRSVVQDALDSGLLQLSISIGLYVVVAGGVLGIAGALSSLGVGQARVPGAGPGLTGWAAPVPPSSPAPPPPPTSAPSPWATPPPPDTDRPT